MAEFFALIKTSWRWVRISGTSGNDVIKANDLDNEIFAKDGNRVVAHVDGGDGFEHCSGDTDPVVNCES